jgi:hypothetical protein
LVYIVAQERLATTYEKGEIVSHDFSNVRVYCQLQQAIHSTSLAPFEKRPERRKREEEDPLKAIQHVRMIF